MKNFSTIWRFLFSSQADKLSEADFKNVNIKKNKSLGVYKNDPAILKKTEQANKDLANSILPKALQKQHV